SVPSEQASQDVPEGIMTKCPQCKKIMLTKELDKNLRVCMNCGRHLQMNAKQRILSLIHISSPRDPLHDLVCRLLVVKRGGGG
ncbi:hypothetical protein ACQ4LK_25815, partial [Bacillus pumilus]